MNIYLIKIKNHEGLTFLQGFTYDLKQIINDLKQIPLEKTYSYEIYKTNDLKELPSLYQMSISKDFELSNWWEGTYIPVTNYYFNLFKNILKLNKITGSFQSNYTKLINKYDKIENENLKICQSTQNI